MVTQFDDKGKIFTQVISKKPVDVIIQIGIQTIRGTIHLRPTERVIDEINHTQGFMAVTDATVLNASGEVMYITSFLSLNVDHITWVIPSEEINHIKDQND
jgi:hypothetical protein